MDTSRQAIECRVETFRQQCGERGLSLTPQRLAIYRVLASDETHLSAEDIFQRIKPQMPSLALGTVYRTLELLENHGLIRRVPTHGNQARFDADLSDHAHLVCMRCGRVADLHTVALPVLAVPESSLHGFRVLARRVQLLGLCGECQDGLPETIPSTDR
ncbi:MAG: Fur family transcriptional regulator [Gemmataceae bacterium]